MEEKKTLQLPSVYSNRYLILKNSISNKNRRNVANPGGAGYQKSLVEVSLCLVIFLSNHITSYKKIP